MSGVKCGFDDSATASGAELLVGFGPTLIANVGFDRDYDAANLSKPPLPGVEGIHALIDTGAVECCVDSALAALLHLPIVDRRRISGATGAEEVNVHLAQVHVPSLRFTIHGLFSGVHLTAGGQPHAVLIGRTFLRNFVMVYEGSTGTVMLTHAPPRSAQPP